MLFKLKFSLLTIAASLMLAGSPALAYNPLSSACSGQAASSPVCQQAGAVNNKSANPVNSTIKTAANIIAVVTGIIAVIMIFISAIVMITSRGDANSVAGARNRIIYAAVGLVIIGLAWAIVSYIVAHIT